MTSTGLLYNDNITITAAMCIEPVVNTVFAAAFGAMISDKTLFYTGLINNTLVLAMCFAIGYVYGIVGLLWKWSWSKQWPTRAMMERGTLQVLWYGCLQAVAGGSAASLAVLADNTVRNRDMRSLLMSCVQPALVGIAMALNFMTPMTNSGILIAYVTHVSIDGNLEVLRHYNYSGQEYQLKPSWAPVGDYEPVFFVDQRYECAVLALVR